MIAIVGGGPAALGAALACGKAAQIYERNAFCGKKLLLSGSGQCNFTNALPKAEFLSALGEFRTWLKPAFYAFDNTAFMQLLEENSCPAFVREDGKVFPKSMRSADVRDTLVNLVQIRGTKINYSSMVQDISPQGTGFLLKVGNATIKAEKVILASGGAAWPDTGSDGFSYRIAQKLGHQVLAPVPALASVRIRNYPPFDSCAGISLSPSTLIIGKDRFQGDLLFTHQGLSGPLILDNSRRMQPGQTIRLVFDPQDRLFELLQSYPKKQISSILQMLALPKSLCEAILLKLQIPKDASAAHFNAVHRKSLRAFLTGGEFIIRDIESLVSAMSDFGGIQLNEVTARSMQSQKTPGLYFAGESLAYALPTGGFSIQMAVSTGYLAALSAMNDI